VARLAQNLGVSPDQLRGAIQQTMQEMQQQQPQAGGPGRPPEQLLMAAVEVLGITPDALQQQLAQGSSPATIAEGQGIDPDAFAEALTNAIEQMRMLQMESQIREWVDQPMVQR